nr:STT3 domain-containing protein [Halobacterium salinarum]
MSETTDASGLSSGLPSRALGALKDWYHVPVLGAVLAFMFWVRVQSWDNFLQNGEVYLSGNDAYYHLRQVTYTVHHFPETMPFDPWTNFPHGTLAGQFGTLFDQILAAVALVVGMGSPSDHTIAMTLLLAPPVFGALLVVPTYVMGRRIAGRLGGLFGAVILGLLPGYFLQRTLAGAADHNGAEPLFMTLAVVGLMVALSVAEREKPVFEQFRAWDATGLRDVVGWSVLAGVATAVYMWVWPPGVLLVGIFGAFFLVKLVGDYVTGTSPDHVAVVGAVSMTTTALLMFAPLGESGFGVSGFSFLQPVFALGVAVGCVVLAWLARVFDERSLSPAAYVATVAGTLVVVVGALALVAPGFWSSLQSNLLNYIGLSSTADTRTIGEAQPFLFRTGRYGLGMFGVVFLEYGTAFFSALVGAGAILLKPHLTSGSVRRIVGVAGATAVLAIVAVSPAVPAAIGGVVGLGGQLTALLIAAVVLAAIAATGQYDADKLLLVVWGGVRHVGGVHTGAVQLLPGGAGRRVERVRPAGGACGGRPRPSGGGDRGRLLVPGRDGCHRRVDRVGAGGGTGCGRSHEQRLRVGAGVTDQAHEQPEPAGALAVSDHRRTGPRSGWCGGVGRRDGLVSVPYAKAGDVRRGRQRRRP